MEGCKACSNHAISRRQSSELEVTTSRTLGPNDTTSKSSLLRRDEEIGTGHKVWRKKQPQHQVLDPLTKMRGIEAVEPTNSAGSGNVPESNGVDIRPEVNEDNASLPKDFLNSQEEGHITQNQVNLESRVKDAKGKGAATDLEGNSSEDENESSYVDSSLYGFTDSTPLDPIAYLSNIEDGVFGTRSNFVSASQVSSPCDVVYVGTGVPSRRDVDSGNPSKPERCWDKKVQILRNWMEKDPLKPKQPLSAFFVFTIERRAENKNIS
nr:hypothetical protein Iba_chr05dCG12610 [Ipomoea batatas]